jgi:hypothetical protein
MAAANSWRPAKHVRLVIDGPWWGHEVLIAVYRAVQGSWWQRLVRRVAREFEPPAPVEALSFTADYWQVDPHAPGGDGEPDGSFNSLESLMNFLAGATIEWNPPMLAARLVDQMRTGPTEHHPPTQNGRDDSP